jgi:2-methylisocitrate lyase-like PEP mutase family enzyme
MFPNYCSKWS